MTPNEHWIIFALVLAFVAGNAIAETASLKAMNPAISMMSDYLTIRKWGPIQSGTYVGLSIGMILFAIWQHETLWYLWQLPLFAGAIALISVVVTAWAKRDLNTASMEYHELDQLHIASAGLALAGMFVAGGYYSWHRPEFWFVILALITAALFRKYDPKGLYGAVDEKLVSALAVILLIAMTGVTL